MLLGSLFWTERFCLFDPRVIPIFPLKGSLQVCCPMIDSSHWVGGTFMDVVIELTEVLPRLKPGALVHIHDIFFPNHGIYLPGLRPGATDSRGRKNGSCSKVLK